MTKKLAHSEAAGADVAALSFEQALAELEGIVRELETGRPDLKQMMDMIRRGTALQARCQSTLKAARLEVEKIIEDAGGTLSTAPFAASE